MPSDKIETHPFNPLPDFNQHRDWHVYALGSVLYQLNLRQHHASALGGLMTLSPLRASILFTLHAGESSTYGQALNRVLACTGDEMEMRGRYVSWLRSWTRYREEQESWLNEDEGKRLHGAWRRKEMTRGQRELVRVTATLLDILIPSEMSRGAAADFLEEHGANLRYRLEA